MKSSLKKSENPSTESAPPKICVGPVLVSGHDRLDERREPAPMSAVAETRRTRSP